MAAQCIHESGHGTSPNGNNYFGIKVPGGATYAEHVSMQDSFYSYARLLAGSKIYAEARKYTGQPKKFLEEIKKAGYAEDPKYVELVSNVMNNLTSATA